MACKGEGNCYERNCVVLTCGETTGVDSGSRSTVVTRQGVQREVSSKRGGE